MLAPLCHQPPAVGYLDHSNTSVMVILVWAQGIPGPSVQNYFIASHPLLLLMHGVIPSHITLMCWASCGSHPCFFQPVDFLLNGLTSELSTTLSQFCVVCKRKNNIEKQYVLLYFVFAAISPTSQLCNKELWKLIAWNWSELYVKKPWMLPRTFMKKRI